MAMIFDEISNIVSEIQKAKEIQASILFFSREPHTIDRASKLSEVVSKLQANVISLQSEHIKIMKRNKDREKNIKQNTCIKFVE